MEVTSNGHVSEQRIEQFLTGEPFSLGYRPSLPVTQFWNVDGTPYLYVLRDVEPMLAHPQVTLPLAYYKAGIAGAKITVKSKWPQVADYVYKSFNRFWQRSRRQVQHSYDYGWGGFEVCWVMEDGLLYYDFLIDFSPRDVYALTRNNRYIGIRVRGSKGSTNADLWGPHKAPSKGFWFAHKRRYNQFYGRTQLYGAWRPWRRLAGQDGAETVIDGGIYRFAYRGPIVRFPLQDFRTKPGASPSTPQSAREKAREWAENAKAGVSVAMPSNRYKPEEGGEFMWDLEWPEQTLNVDGLIGYAKYLKEEICVGIEVPPELIQAGETGTGYSGRAIPAETFYEGQQGNAEALIFAADEQIFRPGVDWNFGPDKTYEIQVESLLKIKEQAAQGAGGQAGSQPAKPGTALENRDPANIPLPPPGPDQLAIPSKAPEVIRPVEPETPVRLAATPPAKLDKGHETADPKAEGVFARSLKAINELTTNGKRDLLAAVKNGTPADRLRRARAVLDRYRPLLAKTISDLQLASALAGMKEVSQRMPELEVPESLGQEKAADLVNQARTLPPDIRDRFIKDLPKEQAHYVQTILEIPSGPILPPEPPWSVPTTPAGEAKPVISFPVIDQAVEDLQKRKLLTREQFDQLSAEAKGNAFTVAGIESEQTLGKIQDALAENIRKGVDLAEFEKAMEESLPGTFLSPAHLETVFRTNVQAAFANGLDQVLDHPLVTDAFPYVEYTAIHDDRVRPEHKALEKLGIAGTAVYRRDDPVFQRFKPPWDYNCFVPGTEVQGRFNVGLKSWYSGKVVEITTRSGNKLTVTANHPILGPDGFVTAQHLCQGDYVLSYRSRVKHRPNTNGMIELAVSSFRTAKRWLSSPDKHKQNSPTSIKQVFRSLRQFGLTQRMPIGPDDLHGDARFGDGQVEIVRADRELLMDIQARQSQGPGDLIFPTMDESESFESGLRPQGNFLRRRHSSFGSLPSGRTLTHNSGPAFLDESPFQFLRFGSASDLDASRFEQSSYSRSVEAEFATELVYRYSGLVAADQIIQVRKYDFSGHVYDLQSEGGWIVADGIFTSNCRCGVNPLSIDQAADKGISEAKTWLETGNPPDKPAWVEMPNFSPPPGWSRGTVALSLALRDPVRLAVEPEIGEIEIDENLWREIQALIPQQRPSALPQNLGHIDDGKVTVFLVDGDKIKLQQRQGRPASNRDDEDFMDFVEGGNGIEDPGLCGRDEIYLDDNVQLSDLPFVCYHEAVERRDMLAGMAYEQAHDRANAAERILRARAVGEPVRLSSFKESDHPRGQPDNSGEFASKTEGSQVSDKTEKAATSWLSKAADIPGQMLDKARTVAKSKFDILENRYGRKQAIAILAAGIVGTAVPLPGTGLLAMAPLIGLAELYRALKREAS